MWDRFGQRPIDHGWWPGISTSSCRSSSWWRSSPSGSGPCIGSRRNGGWRSSAPAPRLPRRGDGALEELRLRYARGELDRDDFAQRFRDLGGEGTGAPAAVLSGGGVSP